jgi:hypothetical protein
MYVRVFIEVSDHTYMSIYVYTIFLKINKSSMFVIHGLNSLGIMPNQAVLTPARRAYA